VPGHDARAEEEGQGQEEEKEEVVSAPPDPAIERVAETGSTNDDLLARVHAAAAAGAATFAPCLLVAERQSAGRGRHGRRWHAEPTRSLTFSIGWPCARADLSGLSLAIGVALADALEPPGNSLRIALKWPNDLWLVEVAVSAPAGAGRKLAGVLVETAPLGRARVAVIGIGINVGAQAVPDASAGAASLDEIDPAATPATTLARIAAPLFAALRRFDGAGFAPFADRFAARDLLRGRRVAGQGARGELEGIAAGIGVDGALRIVTAAGTVAVTSGEWRLSSIAPARSPC
jgi:BirA family biotin operon repressor/biotin-[acetyl-CoA-carboxylase] ligase